MAALPIRYAARLPKPHPGVTVDLAAVVAETRALTIRTYGLLEPSEATVTDEGPWWVVTMTGHPTRSAEPV